MPVDIDLTDDRDGCFDRPVVDDFDVEMVVVDLSVVKPYVEKRTSHFNKL